MGIEAVAGSILLSTKFDNESFSNSLKKLGKVAVAGIAAASAAVGTLLTMSIKEFADYEQLVGGVETLFKSSSDQVMQYANNAFKTAGLSANEYMATVTSFSARLLQGLGGDTAKAAEIADLAITDMADNANKMGTAMGDIQNAYQGFAKQNYTMLDNLKLGYGGTASEMARLINDSGVLGEAITVTAETVNDVSFDKIIEAIHVIQTEMGITGTTALEAAETIQGSLNMTKSAWKNLVTGLADDTQDFDTLINNFVDSVGIAAKNLLPRIQQAFIGVGKLVAKLVPIIVNELPGMISAIIPELISSAEQMVSEFVSSISENLPFITKSIMQLFQTFANSVFTVAPQLLQLFIQIIAQVLKDIVDALPGFIESFISALMVVLPILIEAIITFISESLPLLLEALIMLINALLVIIPLIIELLIENLPTIIDAIVNALLSSLPLIIEGALAMFYGLIDAIPLIIAILIENLPMIITTIIDGLIAALPVIIEASVQLLLGLIQAIPIMIPMLIAAVPQIIRAIVQGLGSGISSLLQSGKNLVKGIWQGISNSLEWIKEKITGWVGNVTSFIKKLFGIKSPSKLMRDEIGKMLGLGIGEGFEDSLPDVFKDVKKTIDFETKKLNANVNVTGRAQDIAAGNMSTVTNQQVINFNSPMQAPDEVARAIRLQNTYGLAGAR